jgi:FkbM family methyltransferase
VKQRLRAARLYVKSALHAGLFAVLRTFAVSPLLLSRHSGLRHFLFEAIYRSGYDGLLVTSGPSSILVHHSRDRGPGRDLFIRGSQDFGKFETALRLLRESGAQPVTRLLDVGANIGTICIPAVRRGLVTSALAVEAVPAIVRLLQANIILNDVADTIEVVRAAVSDHGGDMIEIAINTANQGDNRIAADTVSADDKGNFHDIVRVATTTLDDLLTNGVEGTLIWMDIQGHEGIALRGAARTLREKPPLVLEFCPLLMRRSDSYEALRAAVAGYRGFHDLARPGSPRPLPELDVLREELGFRGNFTDILLVP